MLEITATLGDPSLMPGSAGDLISRFDPDPSVPPQTTQSSGTRRQLLQSGMEQLTV
ncbi:hypothetical protein IQ266_05785 [filamentous cyanobacterium LEGE 11480]|uniref:Uncharacterized protein n=1 Tax=Romeriopsis navalis LEGE 11480 TaxID=2777977 RepID=A0A928VIL2_9CYAN|nr:hypothetical protein [Romeriopsis navalis]MBE9029271.1 hypothetical protein [Romeriopsis navalis LEGE 11480]